MPTKIRIENPRQLDVRRREEGYSNWWVKFMGETNKIYEFECNFDGNPITMYIQKDIQRMYNPNTLMRDNGVKLLFWPENQLNQPAVIRLVSLPTLKDTILLLKEMAGALNEVL